MKDPDIKAEPTTKELRQKERKKEQQCLYCPPNQGENAGRVPKYGEKKSKEKNHRRNR